MDNATPGELPELITVPATAWIVLGSALVLVSLPVTWPTELVESDGWVRVLLLPSTESRTPRLESGLPAASRTVTVIVTSSCPSATAVDCEMSMVDLAASMAAPVTHVPPALQTPPAKQFASEVHWSGAGPFGVQAATDSNTAAKTPDLTTVVTAAPFCANVLHDRLTRLAESCKCALGERGAVQRAKCFFAAWTIWGRP